MEHPASKHGMNFTNGTIGTHNGSVTITSPTGEHRTFNIRTQPDDSRFAPGQRVVRLLTGPDDWQGFGFVSDNGTIRVWKRYQGTAHATYARMLERPESFVAKGAEYLFSGRCRVCNRELTHPESIASGIGPVCAGRV